MKSNTENIEATTEAMFAGLLEMARKGAVDAKQKSFRDVKIDRDGDKIILPEGMSYQTGREWLTKQEEAEETEVAIRSGIPGFPLDGALALSKAMKNLFGFTSFTGGFFSPPRIITIPTGPNPQDKEDVLWGRFTPPGVEGFIQPGIDVGPDGFPNFLITGAVKRKHEHIVRAIITETERVLKAESIYKGQAIILDLSYMRNGESFDPENHAPKFIQGLEKVTEEQLILDKVTTFELESSVWARIEQTESVLEHNVPLKHGVLLAGPYGTGKTLTSQVTAAKARRNGWTYIYLKDVRDLAEGLRFASMYGPAVLFAEDIDRAVTGERSTEMDKILNTLDGVDTKGQAVITVLTTNHEADINPAFLRAGRIDSYIKMGLPDADAAARFLTLYGGDKISDNVNLLEAGEHFAGLIPAYIATAVHKAIMATIKRKGDAHNQVDMEALIDAAEAAKAHAKRVAGVKPETRAERVEKAMLTISEVLGGGLTEEQESTLDNVETQVDQIHSAIS